MILNAIAFLIKYRKIFIIGAVVLSLGVAWTHGFFKGKSYGEVKIVTKIIEANNESKKGSDNVRKKEQSLDAARIDAGLCDLGIVRGNTGCK